MFRGVANVAEEVTQLPRIFETGGSSNVGMDTKLRLGPTSMGEEVHQTPRTFQTGGPSNAGVDARLRLRLGSTPADESTRLRSSIKLERQVKPEAIEFHSGPWPNLKAEPVEFQRELSPSNPALNVKTEVKREAKTEVKPEVKPESATTFVAPSSFSNHFAPVQPEYAVMFGRIRRTPTQTRRKSRRPLSVAAKTEKKKKYDRKRYLDSKHLSELMAARVAEQDALHLFVVLLL